MKEIKLNWYCLMYIIANDGYETYPYSRRKEFHDTDDETAKTFAQTFATKAQADQWHLYKKTNLGADWERVI